MAQLINSLNMLCEALTVQPVESSYGDNDRKKTGFRYLSPPHYPLQEILIALVEQLQIQPPQARIQLPKPVLNEWCQQEVELKEAPSARPLGPVPLLTLIHDSTADLNLPPNLVV